MSLHRFHQLRFGGAPGDAANEGREGTRGVFEVVVNFQSDARPRNHSHPPQNGALSTGPDAFSIEDNRHLPDDTGQGAHERADLAAEIAVWHGDALHHEGEGHYAVRVGLVELLRYAHDLREMSAAHRATNLNDVQVAPRGEDDDIVLEQGSHVEHMTGPSSVGIGAQCQPPHRPPRRAFAPSAAEKDELVTTTEQSARKLEVLVRPPREHLVRFHGVFAPNAKHRARVVPGSGEPARQAGESVGGAPYAERRKLSHGVGEPLTARVQS